MAIQSFDSFGALREEITSPAARGEREVLRLSAELEAADHRAAARTCRATLLEWAASAYGGELPPEGAAHGAFSVSRGLHRCEAVRVDEPNRDVWSVRVRQPPAPGAGGHRIIEAACEARTGEAALVRFRLLVEGDRAPANFAPRVPGALTELASHIPLRHSGERITPDPWLVDSDAAAERLADALTDPDRQRPILVLSVPEDAPDPTRPLLDPEPLAQATFGLATVVVLPATYTWKLTNRFGDKRLAVYWGAVRLYLPGFRLDTNGREHRLIMGEWLQSPEKAKRNRAELLRRIAEYSLRWQPAWSFEEIRDLAEPDAAPVAPVVSPPVATLRPPEPASASAESEPPAPSPPRSEDAPPVAAATLPPDPPPVPDPEPPQTREPQVPARGGPGGWLHRTRRRLAAFLSRAPEPAAEDHPEQERWDREKGAWKAELDAARESLAVTRQALLKSEEEKASYFAEWEQADKRAQAAERQRNGAEGRIAQLDLQLRNLDRIPVPDGWKEMSNWCETEFGGRVELRPGAVQGLKKAEFDDLWLAAECIAWLAGPYRRSRRAARGLPPDIKKDVNSRVTDGPAGKGVHFRDWDHVPLHERRNVKRGNNRERKNCLRIYYYWDAEEDRIVIVSMPHHAQTRAS